MSARSRVRGIYHTTVVRGPRCVYGVPISQIVKQGNGNGEESSPRQVTATAASQLTWFFRSRHLWFISQQGKFTQIHTLSQRLEETLAEGVVVNPEEASVPLPLTSQSSWCSWAVEQKRQQSVEFGIMGSLLINWWQIPNILKREIFCDITRKTWDF